MFQNKVKYFEDYASRFVVTFSCLLGYDPEVKTFKITDCLIEVTISLVNIFYTEHDQ